MIVGHMHALDQPWEWVWQDNALYLIPGGVGGTETYLRGVLAALAEIDPVNRYYIFTNRETGPDLTPAQANFITLQQPIRAVSRPARILWERAALDLFARHWKTGERLPDVPEDRQRQLARRFNPRAQNDESLGDGRADRVRRRHHGALDHVRMLHQRALQLEWADAIIRGFEHVIGAPDKREVAIRIA